MKLKYLIAVAAGSICNSVGASHLGRFHGLRSSASLTEQQQKKKNLTARLGKHKQHRLLAVQSTRDIVVTEEPADSSSYVPKRQRISSSRKKNRRDDNSVNKNIFYDKEEVAKHGNKKYTKTSKPSQKSSDAETCSDDKRIACGNKRLLLCRHEEDGVSRTVCMKEKRIADHLGRYTDDYCGSCTDDDVETTTSTTTTTSSTTSSHQSSRSKSKKKDESKSSKSQDEKTTEETTTTTSTPPSSVSSVLNLLEEFDNSEDALDSIDPVSLAVLVNAVRTLVSDNMQHLVTEQSVVSSFFPDDDYHADLFPYRRRLRDHNPNFFGLSPDGCRGATSSMISKVMMIVFLFAGVDNPAEVSQRVTQEYVMLESHDSLMSEIFEVYDSSLFTGSSIDTLKAGMSIWWQLWRYFGLKELYSVAKSSSETPDNLEVSTYLAMVALSVTNGAPLIEDISLFTSAVDELTNEGVDWVNTCFITSCDGEAPLCDDGNKCTLNRNHCNSNTEWAWECTHHAKICSPGYSCDPSDGDCKPDDVLVPCVAVIDEDDGFGSPNQMELWNQFRSRFPARPFCVLVPSSSTSNTVTPPDSFLEDDLTIVHYDVVRDNNDVSLAMDWVSMCGLDLYTDTNVQWVGLFIDNSGSMRESNVAASRDKFYARLEQQGIEVKKVVNPNENWILPFLETLVPEEENSVHLNQYVFWPSFDSEGFDIIQHGSLSISALAGICNSNVDCLGFNSNGWLKSQIKPLDQWVELALDRKEDKGLYIKKPESYSIEQGRRLSSASGRELFKRPLSEEEEEWLNYITKYTIPYHPLPRYEAILQIAWGTLWSLKTGALNGNLWRSNSDYTPVDNPFLHTLCNEAFFDPFEVCTANDWSVGIALNDPKDYTLPELEADASYYYPDIDTASKCQ